jgi:medium-chain acyl-[acyl-carrier-protein] hydrolase
MANSSESSSWFICHKPNPMARLRLFCFPYGGGGPSTFYNWPKELPPDVETIGIQMPGLESRIMELPIESISMAVQSLRPRIYPKLDKPFAFFGHSLGALISFELARAISEQYSVQPTRLFVSGMRAPHIPIRRSPIHELPEVEFLKELNSLFCGIPEEILENPDMLRMLLPGLRACLKMAESYRYRGGDPLECDITAFGGHGDNTAPRKDLEAWRYHTKAKFTLHMIAGNHFFINSEPECFLRVLSDELTAILTRLE